MGSEPETWQHRQSRVLTELRERAGASQDDVAKRAGMKFWTYVRIETGKQVAKADQIEPLARAFGLSDHELLDLLQGVTSLAPARPWSPRAEMEASGVVAPSRIDQVEADIFGKPEKAQRARVAAEIALGPDPDARTAHETHTDGQRTG